MSFKDLFTIDERLRVLLDTAADPETGEIPDDKAAEIDALEMDKSALCLDVAAWGKECGIEAEAITKTAKELIGRAQICERKQEWAKAALMKMLPAGQKLRNEHVAISWRKSEAVVVTDEAALPELCWKIVRAISKTAIREAIESGQAVAGAKLETRNNVQVK